MNYSSPQGLASLGRNGDSMLVHMSPEEVQGLQGLAMAQGGSLTINPETGLPEAFKLKNVFKAALPIAAGFMFPGFGTTFMGGMLGKGVAAGALTGAGIAALSGENPFLGALTGGFGGYGGAGLAGSAAKIGAGAKAATTAEANLINQGIGTSGLPTGGGFSAGTTATDIASNAQLMAPKIAPAIDTAVNTGLTAQGTFPSSLMSSTKPLQAATTPLQTAGENFGTLMNSPMDVIKDYGYGNSAMLAGGPLVSGLEPSDLGYTDAPLYKDPDTGKYRGPQGQLNLSDRFDTGLRLVAKGGYINGYALGGAVDVNPPEGGGISDLYNRPEGQRTTPLSSNGYGIGRLNNLAGEQSMTQAQTLGYADGGDVGMNLDKLPTLNVNTGISSLGGSSGMSGDAMYSFNDNAAMSPIARMLLPQMSQSDRAKFLGSGMGTFFGMQERPKQDYYTSSGALTSSYAQGGYLNGNGDGMSDSIPATIEGKQPARLADGEFVIPADVVSHLGNGSSKAGSKRLYAMLDKVRHARTGNKKQGKEINPAKYMPA
jgi:hypothetical protein